MADPDFVNRVFKVKIQPAIVFVNGLMQMTKLNTWAVLIVTEKNKFQIVAWSPKPTDTCAMLEMESNFIYATSDGYALLFHLHTWYQSLRNPILHDPSSSLSIRKASDSLLLFGLLGKNRQIITLGDAEFIKSSYSVPINLSNTPHCARVTMIADQFRQLVLGFAGKYGRHDSLVQMSIGTDTIRWITKLVCYDHPAEWYKIEGVTPENCFTFTLRWDFGLFLTLCSASLRYEFVELTVFQISEKVIRYRFRMLVRDESHYFGYIEKEIGSEPPK